MKFGGTQLIHIPSNYSLGAAARTSFLPFCQHFDSNLVGRVWWLAAPHGIISRSEYDFVPVIKMCGHDCMSSIFLLTAKIGPDVGQTLRRFSLLLLLLFAAAIDRCCCSYELQLLSFIAARAAATLKWC